MAMKPAPMLKNYMIDVPDPANSNDGYRVNAFQRSIEA
jgi:hypothetical protein